MKSVEIRPAVRYGWESIKNNFWYFVGMAFIYTVLVSVPSSKNDSVTYNIIGFLVSAYFTAGLMRLILSFFDGKKLPLADMFVQYKYFWRVLGASFLISLITIFGLILLIVPGIIWAIKYQFAINLIVDKDMGIKEAMAKSAELTQGVKLQLIALDLTLLGIIILGALVLGVGIFVAIPLIWLAEIYVYRTLLKATE